MDLLQDLARHAGDLTDVLPGVVVSQTGDVEVSLVNTESQVPGQEDLTCGEDGVASPPHHHPALALWNIIQRVNI